MGWDKNLCRYKKNFTHKSATDRGALHSIQTKNIYMFLIRILCIYSYTTHIEVCLRLNQIWSTRASKSYIDGMWLVWWASRVNAYMAHGRTSFV